MRSRVLVIKSGRTLIGGIASLCWIGIVGFIALKDPEALHKMTPNEWGDFLAGSFAPLAFLWLVLGYLQQGDELRLSTDALRLQAEELKNSVQQQRDLVEVSRQQVEGEREALAYERRLREDLSEPKFLVLGAGGSFQGNGHSTYNISISNSGHDATAFSAQINLLEAGWREIMSYPLFSKGASYNVGVPHPTPLQEGNSLLKLHFTDGLGRVLERTYRIGLDGNQATACLVFQRVDG